MNCREMTPAPKAVLKMTDFHLLVLVVLSLKDCYGE